MGIGIGMILLILLVIVIRLLAGGMDHDRVRQYIASQDGRVLDVQWAPFGPGWFGEKSDRIYQVRYLDKNGNEHEAHCKTSLLTGVYFTQDQIVKHANQPTGWEAESLEEENRRLREELKKLKGNQR